MEESSKKNQGFIETFLDRKSLYDRIQQLKKEDYTVGEKEYDYDYTNHKKMVLYNNLLIKVIMLYLLIM